MLTGYSNSPAENNQNITWIQNLKSTHHLGFVSQRSNRTTVTVVSFEMVFFFKNKSRLKVWYNKYILKLLLKVYSWLSWEKAKGQSSCELFCLQQGEPQLGGEMIFPLRQPSFMTGALEEITLCPHTRAHHSSKVELVSDDHRGHRLSPPPHPAGSSH